MARAPRREPGERGAGSSGRAEIAYARSGGSGRPRECDGTDRSACSARPVLACQDETLKSPSALKLAKDLPITTLSRSLLSCAQHVTPPTRRTRRATGRCGLEGLAAPFTPEPQPARRAWWAAAPPRHADACPRCGIRWLRGSVAWFPPAWRPRRCSREGRGRARGSSTATPITAPITTFPWLTGIRRDLIPIFRCCRPRRAAFPD